MTLNFPYSLPTFADRLPISSVEWSIKRRDSLSGQGSGRIWQAELADPLWRAVIELDRRASSEMKQYAALIRALRGAQEMFWLYDPLSPFPQKDPRGLALGSRNIQIAAIGADMRSMRFSGFPAGYALTVADKFQVSFGASPVRSAFLEISESGTADADGVTPFLSIFPNVPVGVSANTTAIFAKPACRMVIMPESHQAGRARRHLTEGAGFTAIQKP
ncbi:hypothetical protein [Rhizobium sp. Leaf341]|uniref:hypothetical protein n=1 Tax=Rhizobium sp. Leaf341 TaxID=1736344 RepID=UPI000713694B|nr:hypothetical protein [Rhizobium sp. Leaf341]KQR75744.1 hypothetical protein ASG03_18915 [Rhizobium sp. Leaf341]